jgi:hypothetical protein
MQSQDASFPTQLPFGIVVRVSGGQDFAYRISNSEFEQALRDSLHDSGLLPRIVEGAPEYRLDVVLGDGHGIEGRELTVLWSLSRADTQQTLWQKLITSRGRSHHFVGVTRQRRGLEYAAQENIRLGLEQLARVDWTAALGSTAAPKVLEAEQAAP